MRHRTTLILLAAIGSLPAACHKQAPPPETNQTNEAAAPVPPAPKPAPVEAPKPAPKPDKPKPKPAPKLSADQQMMDDADATGMTSHSAGDADGAGTASGGNSQP